MAHTETVLRVFIASPADLDEERSRLEEVIAEWNLSWSTHQGVRLDLIKWETHSRPGVGVDGQDVINRQLGDDYDIFVGLMWCRYGTPTVRAGSGTAEEFQRAKRRFDERGNLGLMFYFKDAEIPPSKIDPSQLMKVNEFKASLGAEGVLYRTFRDSEEFVQLARMHLAKEVQEWKSRQLDQTSGGGTALSTETQLSMPALDDDDEPGLLEYQDSFNSQSAALNEIMERITAIQQELGETVNARKAELDIAGKRLPTDAIEVKRIMSQTALHMTQFSDRLDAEVPLFKKVQRDAISSITKITTISLAMNNQELTDSTAVLFSLRDSMRGALESIRDMRNSAAALPPMTKEFRKARNRQVRSLDAFIDQVAFGEKAMTDVCALMKRDPPSQ